MYRALVLSLLGAAVGLLLAPESAAQCALATDPISIRPPDLPENAQFGSATAVTEELLYATWKPDYCPDANWWRVSAFERIDDAWVERQRLQPSTECFGGFYSSGLAADGNTLLVGEYGAEPNGAVHVYTRSGQRWVETQTLFPPEAANAGTIGFEMAIDGDWIVLGDPGARFGDPPIGAAYLYRHVDGQWVYTQYLRPAEFARYGDFGSSVALEGDLLVVGDDAWNVTGEEAWYEDIGKITMFERRGVKWLRTQEFEGRETRRSFGRSTSLQGSDLLVSYVDPGVTAYHGFVEYRYDAGAWSEVGEIRITDPISESAILRPRLRGDYAAIGIQGVYNGTAGVKIFEKRDSNWTEILELAGATDSQDAAVGSLDWFGDDLVVAQPGGPSGPGDVLTFAACRPGIAAAPRLLSTAEPGRFTGCGVLPGSRFLVAVTTVSEVPYFITLALATADDEGRWALDYSMPLVGPGITFGLVAIAQDPDGTLKVSNSVNVVSRL